MVSVTTMDIEEFLESFDASNIVSGLSASIKRKEIEISVNSAKISLNALHR
jgi:hypothetical protein